MRKLVPLAFLAMSCHGKKQPVQFSSFHGNVFWKYNDYVGNKPDAGADVLLYGIPDSTICYSTKADVRGDFTYDCIPSGTYLLIVTSSNTTSSTLESIGDMYGNSPFLSAVARFNLLPDVKSMYDKRNAFEREGLLVDGFDYSAIRKRQAIKDSADFAVLKYLGSLPDTVRIRTGLKFEGAYPHKRHIELITLEPRRLKTTVVDFGLTYK